MKQKRRRQPKYKNQGKEFPNILNSMVRKSETEDKESDHDDVENLDIIYFRWYCFDNFKFLFGFGRCIDTRF